MSFMPDDTEQQLLLQAMLLMVYLFGELRPGLGRMVATDGPQMAPAAARAVAVYVAARRDEVSALDSEEAIWDWVERNSADAVAMASRWEESVQVIPPLAG